MILQVPVDDHQMDPARITLTGLNTTKFNGRYGTRTKYHPSVERFTVILDALKCESKPPTMRIKNSNITLISPIQNRPTKITQVKCVACQQTIPIVGWEQGRRMCCGILCCHLCLTGQNVHRGGTSKFLGGTSNKCEGCGHRISISPPKNLKRLLKYAQQGKTWSYAILGRCYELGDGCKIDFDQAKSWYEKAVDGSANASALWGLASIIRQQSMVNLPSFPPQVNMENMDAMRMKMLSSWKQATFLSQASAQAEPQAMRSLNIIFNMLMPIPCTYCGAPSANPHSARNARELVKRTMVPCPGCKVGAYYCQGTPCRDLDLKHHEIFCQMCKSGGAPQQKRMNATLGKTYNKPFLVGGSTGKEKEEMLTPSIIVDVPYEDESIHFDPCGICHEQLPKFYHHRVRLTCCGGFVCKNCSPRMNKNNIDKCILCRTEWGTESDGTKRVIKNAKAGKAWAQTMLGSMYEFGRGMPKNEKLARSWHKKSAKQNYYVGQNCLGIMLKNGCGGPKDVKTAIKWFERAGTDQGFNQGGMAAAQANAGGVYLQGFGDVPMNKEKGLFWLDKAARGGSQGAMWNLGFTMLEDAMKQMKEPPDSAVFWIGQSAARGAKIKIIFEKAVKTLHMIEKMGIAVPCSYCGTITKATKKCSGCKGALWLCSKKCLKGAWKNGHKSICKDIQQKLKAGTIKILKSKIV